MSNEKPPRQPQEWVIHTSQETDTFFRGAADGRNGRNWIMNVQGGAFIYDISGLSHTLRLEFIPEISDGVLGPPAWVQEILESQDADTVLAALYILNALAPPGPLPPKFFYGDTIELDDVIKKMGWDPRTKVQREEMRKRVWHMIQFGQMVRVVGERSGRKFVDPLTGEEVNTAIDSPLWSIQDKERTVDPSGQTGLFPWDETPLSVQVILNPKWANLLTASATSQFLPFGERIASIPGSRVSGAWARVIGLAWINFCRRHPQKMLADEIRPTRAELLQHYTPKMQPVEELLRSSSPHHALEYWVGALRALVSKGLIEKQGEALTTVENLRAGLPRYDWGSQWLETKVLLVPTLAVREALEGRSAAIEAAKPKKRGRPRKIDASRSSESN